MSEFHVTNFQRGAAIFQEGDEGRTAYLIRSGSVVIHRSLAGRQVVLAQLQAGEVFGELALVNAGKRTASATAAGDVELVAMPEEPFREQLQKMSPLVMEVFSAMARRLENTSRQVRSPRTKHPVSSICRILNLLREVNWQQRRATIAVNDVVEQVQAILDLDTAPIYEVFDQLARQGLIDWRGADGKPTGSVHFKDADTFNARVTRFIDGLPERDIQDLELKAATVANEAAAAAAQQAAKPVFLDLKTIEEHHGLTFREIRRFISSGELPPDMLHFPAKEMMRWITQIREAYGDDKAGLFLGGGADA